MEAMTSSPKKSPRTLKLTCDQVIKGAQLCQKMRDCLPHSQLLNEEPLKYSKIVANRTLLALMDEFILLQAPKSFLFACLPWKSYHQFHHVYKCLERDSYDYYQSDKQTTNNK